MSDVFLDLGAGELLILDTGELFALSFDEAGATYAGTYSRRVAQEQDGTYSRRVATTYDGTRGIRIGKTYSGTYDRRERVASTYSGTYDRSALSRYAAATYSGTYDRSANYARVGATFAGTYSRLGARVSSTETAVTITAPGQSVGIPDTSAPTIDVPFSEAYIRHDTGNGAWIGSASLTNAADYALFPLGGELTLTVNGTAYSLVVTGRRYSRNEVQAPQYVLDVASPHAALSPVSVEFNDAILASDVPAALGLTVTWSATDWTINPGLLTVQNETPLAVLIRLASVVGAFVQCSPDGTLEVLPGYTEVASSGDFTEDDDLFSVSEYRAAGIVFNRVSVGDGTGDSAGIAAETRAADSDTGELEASSLFRPGEQIYVLVWRGGESVVAAACSTGATVTKGGTHTESVEQSLTFDAGEPVALQYHPSGAVSETWLGNDAGPLTIAGNVATPSSDSLAVCRVEYEAIADVWSVPAPADIGDEESYPVVIRLTGAEGGTAEIVVSVTI